MTPRPPLGCRRRGFTALDLLALVVTSVLLLAMVPLVHAQVFNVRQRTACQANLKQIAMGMLLYANDNNGMLPAAASDPKAAPTAFTKEPQPNDVTAALYLLIPAAQLQPEHFVCPATDANAMPKGNATNFPGRDNLGYSYQNPYPRTLRVNQVRGAADFAVVADMNPGGAMLLKVASDAPPSQMNAANSPNHRREGQNVGYLDGHVDWHPTPFAGVERDNIFTYGQGAAQGIAGPRAGESDSILLPAIEAAPAAAATKPAP